MKVVPFKDAAALMERCKKWLFENEALNNGLIGTLDLLIAGSSVYTKPFWLGAVENDGNIVGVAVHAKPDGLVTTRIPIAALDDLLQAIDEAIGAPHRILAPKAVAGVLAVKWAERSKLRQELQVVWNVYMLRSLAPPARPVAGSLRLGDDNDRDIVRDWGRIYGEEVPAPVDVTEFMLRKLRRKELFLWEDNGPTTLVTLSGFTDHGVRVSSVFTPVEFRGRGYASAAVAAVCSRQFEQEMSFVTLVAVDGDPAERIYQRLGFEKIGSRACYNIVPLMHEMK